MAINFPDSPSDGDTVTLNGIQYTYNSTSTTWTDISGSSMSVSDTSPTSPNFGDLWWNSSDLKLYVYYNDGTTSQWVANPSGPTGATGEVGLTGGAGAPQTSTLVLADMAALIATTGMSAGDKALVTGLNKLFMYTGSAWYLIATMTNASPTAITGANATYDLASDGTSTTITLVSTDPEGSPLTWAQTISVGNLNGTTVSNVDNVFTVTPHASNATTFSLQFSATDMASGIATVVSAFTLEFVVYSVLAWGSMSPNASTATGSDNSLTIPSPIHAHLTGAVDPTYAPKIALNNGRRYFEMSFSGDGRWGFNFSSDFTAADESGWSGYAGRSYGSYQSGFYDLHAGVGWSQFNNTWRNKLNGKRPDGSFTNDGEMSGTPAHFGISSFGSGERYNIAYDTNTRKLWIGINNNYGGYSYQNHGSADLNPATSNGMSIDTLTDQTLYMAINSSWSGSYANTFTFYEGSNCTYSPPTGFTNHGNS